VADARRDAECAGAVLRKILRKGGLKQKYSAIWGALINGKAPNIGYRMIRRFCVWEISCFLPAGNRHFYGDFAFADAACHRERNIPLKGFGGLAVEPFLCEFKSLLVAKGVRYRFVTVEITEGDKEEFSVLRDRCRISHFVGSPKTMLRVLSAVCILFIGRFCGRTTCVHPFS
jgi:hypothetical protein